MKHLTKKQLIRENQRKVKKYLTSVLGPVIFKEIHNTVEGGEMPSEWAQIGCDKILKKAIGNALRSQAKNYPNN